VAKLVRGVPAVHQDWHTYIIHRVPKRIYSLNNTPAEVNENALYEEAATVTGEKPLRAAWSIHRTSDEL